MLVMAATEQLTQTIELAIAQQIRTIRVQEDLQAMTLTTGRLTQALLTIVQEGLVPTMRLKAIRIRVRLQVDHRATHTAHLAMIEVRQTILLLVEVHLALQVVLARVQVALAQEVAVVDLVQVARQEDQDNIKYKLNFIPR